jgi:hypothetical protein
MPNNTSNILEVSLVDDQLHIKNWLIKQYDIIDDIKQLIINIMIEYDIKKFINDIKGEELIEFNKLHPLPENAMFLTWCCRNWGTKWDAYNIGEWSFNYNNASIYYETAWNPANEFYLHISKSYPTLQFKQKYADEGDSFLGYNIIYRGEIIKTVDYEWKSEEGILLRQELGRDEDSYYG